MWNVLILWIALSTWILTLKMFSDLIVSELVICVLSVSLNDGIMMYENKDNSTSYIIGFNAWSYCPFMLFQKVSGNA
jgi:hypothetical protein